MISPRCARLAGLVGLSTRLWPGGNSSRPRPCRQQQLYQREGGPPRDAPSTQLHMFAQPRPKGTTPRTTAASQTQASHHAATKMATRDMLQRPRGASWRKRREGFLGAPGNHEVQRDPPLRPASPDHPKMRPAGRPMSCRLASRTCRAPRAAGDISYDQPCRARASRGPNCPQHRPWPQGHVAITQC